MSADAEVIHHAYQRDFLGSEERTACGEEVERDTVSSPSRSEVTCLACLAALGETASAWAAAPSVQSLRLEEAGARLTAMYRRIEAVFEDDTDRHYALEQIQIQIGDALRLLGLPVPAPAGAE